MCFPVSRIIREAAQFSTTRQSNKIHHITNYVLHHLYETWYLLSRFLLRRLMVGDVQVIFMKHIKLCICCQECTDLLLPLCSEMKEVLMKEVDLFHFLPEKASCHFLPFFSLFKNDDLPRN